MDATGSISYTVQHTPHCEHRGEIRFDKMTECEAETEYLDWTAQIAKWDMERQKTEMDANNKLQSLEQTEAELQCVRWELERCRKCRGTDQYEATNQEVVRQNRKSTVILNAEQNGVISIEFPDLRQVSQPKHVDGLQDSMNRAVEFTVSKDNTNISIRGVPPWSNHGFKPEHDPLKDFNGKIDELQQRFSEMKTVNDALQHQVSVASTLNDAESIVTCRQNASSNGQVEKRDNCHSKGADPDRSCVASCTFGVTATKRA